MLYQNQEKELPVINQYIIPAQFIDCHQRHQTSLLKNSYSNQLYPAHVGLAARTLAPKTTRSKSNRKYSYVREQQRDKKLIGATLSF